MKLERDGNGDFIIDAEVVARKFSVGPELFRRHLGIGLVSSAVETGTESDEGRRRLSVRYGNRVWRVVVDAEHNVLAEEMMTVGRSGNLQSRPVPAR